MYKRIAGALAPLTATFILAYSCGLFAEEPATDAAATIYPRAYDGFQASADAQAYWDARRVDAINRQLGWNELFKWRAATSTPTTLYYDPYAPLPAAYSFDGYPAWFGRISGYGFYDPVPQPMGRREVQTGPNRWESFPIYAEDGAPPAALPIAPQPPATKRPVVVPPPTDVPTPAPRGREF